MDHGFTSAAVWAQWPQAATVRVPPVTSSINDEPFGASIWWFRLYGPYWVDWLRIVSAVTCAVNHRAVGFIRPDRCVSRNNTIFRTVHTSECP
jgi:hypothetical protein